MQRKSNPNPLHLSVFGKTQERHRLTEMSTNGGGGAGCPASSRWNPAKEQITMLENFYKQGIRTPTAEQIEEITKKLQVYGHIEGKNVFYWFQNHKARQRQKQKQKQTMAYYSYSNNGYKPASSAFFAPNVVCSPYYLAPPPPPLQGAELGYYPQYPKMVLHPPPPTAGGMMCMKRTPMVLHNPADNYCYPPSSPKQAETLPLFPLEPTGILQTKSPSTSSSDTTTTVDYEDGSSSYDRRPSMFNFFSG